MIRIGLILSSPSPHQVDLLNAIAMRSDVDAFIGYVRYQNPNRHWGRPTPKLPWENLPTRLMQICAGHLHQWVRARSADVWLLSSVYTSPATHLLAEILHRQSRPFAFLGEPPQPRTGLRAIVQRQLMLSVLRRADGIIGTGEESARRYRRIAEPDQPVTSVPYYIDLTGYLAAPPVSAPTDGEPYRFVASAQLIRRKGLDVLINACRRLPETGWTLEIYGDGPLRGELEALCRRVRRPVYLRGLLPYERRDEVFRGKHCFVFSTRWDGWGMVLPEALAMGLPVITTDQAMSAHDFIRAGENGQIGPADDESYLASAMLNALSSPQTLTAQSIAARASLSDYRPEAGAERLVNFLNQVAARAA
ncbi:MAG: glycosyltransferase family 4 protein [Fuerstiella sp.]